MKKSVGPKFNSCGVNLVSVALKAVAEQEGKVMFSFVKYIFQRRQDKAKMKSEWNATA